jgi:hypothetical protein
MSLRWVLVTVAAAVALTFVLTVLQYSPDYCRVDGNPFDCDDLGQGPFSGTIVN